MIIVLVYIHCTICAVLCDVVKCMCGLLVECMFFCKHCHRAKAQLQLNKYILTRSSGKISFPLIRHGPHRKRRVQQFFYCCVCIRCRGKVFIEPLPSNVSGRHTDT
jgi:hypothetical protein